MKQETKVIGYTVITDELKNYWEGETIIIEDSCNDYDWPGTDFFDKHPEWFAPINKKQPTKTTQP